MIETKKLIKNKVGLHARPAAIFVQTAKKYTADIRVQNFTTGGSVVDAKSILMLLTLGIAQNHEILLQADGKDEEIAMRDLCDLIDRNFGEEEEQ